jgi:hypothetical protein
LNSFFHIGEIAEVVRLALSRRAGPTLSQLLYVGVVEHDDRPGRAVAYNRRRV